MGGYLTFFKCPETCGYIPRNWGFKKYEYNNRSDTQRGLVQVANTRPKLVITYNHFLPIRI